MAATVILNLFQDEYGNHKVMLNLFQGEYGNHKVILNLFQDLTILDKMLK